MVVVDCATTPEGLVADLLFGAPPEQARPWFRPGVLELAAGGTVVLEEVCHLPAVAKAMLLKVLGQPPRRGRSREPADTWVISTCNMDMDGAVRHGYFGRALFRRLAEVRIVMPPL
jgi:DNA-binding NtrC family response regulator